MQTTTPAQNHELTRIDPEIAWGGELLDASDAVVADLSSYLTAAGVDHDSRSNGVHRDCSVTLTTALDWDAARVRLWQSVGGYRWDVGVFVLTTPTDELGEDPTSYRVEGFDKLTLAQHAVGDTYVVDAGTGYLDAVRAVLTAAGVTGLSPEFDGEAEGKVLPEPYVWVLDASSPTAWLTVVNDLLTAVGYERLWVDGSGRFRSRPYVDPLVRAVERVFDCTTEDGCVVRAGLTREIDRFGGAGYRTGFNHWTFIREGLPYLPAVGDGLVVIDQVPAGGVKRPRVESVTVVDQVALAAHAARVVDEDTAVTETIEFATGPFPVFEHADVVQLVHSSLGRLKVFVAGWSMPDLSGGDVDVDVEVVRG